jgi:hypothetical protein
LDGSVANGSRGRASCILEADGAALRFARSQPAKHKANVRIIAVRRMLEQFTVDIFSEKIRGRDDKQAFFEQIFVLNLFHGRLETIQKRNR